MTLADGHYLGPASFVTCAWCDEATPADGPCVACGGDPAGPFVRPTGLAAVRQRRLEARRAMLQARAPLPTRAAGTADSADDLQLRLSAALELAPGIVAAPAEVPAPRVWELPDEGPSGRARRWPRRVAAIALIAVLAAVGVVIWRTRPQGAPAGWVTFTGPGFTVDLPGAAGAALGRYVAHGGTTTYTVAVAPVPSSIAATIASIAGTGQVVEARVIAPGAEDVVIHGRSVTTDARLVVAGGRLWVLTASGPAPAHWSAFVRSFRLTA